MTEVKNTQEKASSSGDILWLASSLTDNMLWKLFIGIALLFLANQTFWDPFGKYMDNQFELQTTEQTNTFELQKATLEYIQEDVMGRLDDIVNRLDKVESTDEVQNDRLDSIELWLTNHQ